MDCFKKTLALAAVICLVSTSAVLFVQSDSSDASEITWYDAEVTPFTFPECEGIPILKTLKQATKSVDISIYLLSSKYALSILLEKQSEGVQVRLLIEGEPLDVDLDSLTETRIMKNLVDAGADVRVINYPGCTSGTYPYFHNKYAVVDDETVIVTSENWTANNFSYRAANLGWGAVVKSPGYAMEMKSVFETDFAKTRGDVKDLAEAFPHMEAYTGDLGYTIGEYETKTYSAKVTAACAPDNSWDMLKSFMNSATDRLYCEQLNLSGDYIEAPFDNPYTWMIDKADSGVDTRLILNTTYSDTMNFQKVSTINNDTKVIACGSPDNGTRLVHNKGIVADDSVWVGSMNWTPDSIEYNREVCVIIKCLKISDFFADSFNRTLYTSYVPGGDKETCHVTFEVDGIDTELTYIKGDRILLPSEPEKASESVYTYTFSHWENYTKGMTADSDIKFVAVFDQHTVLEEYNWYVYLVAALAVLAAISLGYWYIRNSKA